MSKSIKDLIIVQNRIYSQVEALTWLSQALMLFGSLPPLRGWAASPDVLLRLHEHIRFQKPKVVVECGSGSSTLVIADALRQNGQGVLISLEHSDKFGAQTRSLLDREELTPWVDLRIADLELWAGPHMNSGKDEVLRWYSASSLVGIKDVDLLFVDGPPGKTCKYARYPALPAIADRLAPNAQIWMDDTVRQEETDIAKDWAENYGCSLEFFSLEKGLGVLTSALPNGELAVDELSKTPAFNVGLDDAIASAFEAHIKSRSLGVTLQFGISSVTLHLAEALKSENAGKLCCVAEPSELLDELQLEIQKRGLESVVSLISAPLEAWNYLYPDSTDLALKRWFDAETLEQLPPLDWVVVDGPDWQAKPYTRYPALPSVLDKLAQNAEVWMLGSESQQVRSVVNAWCSDYSLTCDSSSSRIFKLKV